MWLDFREESSLLVTTGELKELTPWETDSYLIIFISSLYDKNMLYVSKLPLQWKKVKVNSKNKSFESES